VQRNEAVTGTEKVSRHKKSGGSYLLPLFSFKRTSLSVRLVDRPVDRRLVGHHLVFHARAADVHAPLFRDLAVRLVQERWACSVRLDFLVCP
jgi:hypothetical protein